MSNEDFAAAYAHRAAYLLENRPGISEKTRERLTKLSKTIDTPLDARAAQMLTLYGQATGTNSSWESSNHKQVWRAIASL